jgi:chlorite dismutase
LDTCGILSNFLDKSQKTKEDKPKIESDSETKIKYSEKCKNKKVNTVHDITVYNYTKDDNQNMVWNHFFKLNKKTFKKNKYEFNHMIRTDGISICVLFVLLKNGKPMSKAKGKKLKGFLDSNYIENIKNISEINKKFVVADPFLKMKILFQLRNNIFTIFDPL